MSFQSGGIVHYSLDPSRYGKLIVIGAVIFVIGAISSDLIGKESLLRNSGPVGFIVFILSSLLLSIGVGMIGGSVQHFNDIPGRAPFFVGLGIVLSALGYHGRFRPHHTKKEFVGAMVLVSALAIPSVLGLRSYAATLPTETESAAGHGHGSEAGATDGHDDTASAASVPAPAVAGDGHGDGHGDDHEVAATTTAAPATASEGPTFSSSVLQSSGGEQNSSLGTAANEDEAIQSLSGGGSTLTPTTTIHDPETHDH